MSTLRVISGTARGRRLKMVPGNTTRPITDRVKESLFNILGADIKDSLVLDLFAGTGAVGIEALSRGAKFVRFIDRNTQPVKIIRENLNITGFKNKAQVIRMDAFAALDGESDLKFDYIYIAPPQYRGMWIRSLQLLDDRIDWLVQDAWVIIQIHPKEYEHLDLQRLEEFDKRSYGSTLLSFFRISDGI